MVAGAALACLAYAPAALAGIYDGAATPSFQITVASTGAAADMAMGVTADASGAYVAGVLSNAPGNADASLVKVVRGERRWVRSYDSPRHRDDWAYKVAKRGRAVYVAGLSRNAAGTSDILLVKWSSNGTFRWAKRYDGPLHGNDAAVALGIDKRGNVTVAGTSQAAGGDDWVVISWSSAGTRRWVWRYGGNAAADDRPTDLVVDGGGRIYISGWVTLRGPRVKAKTVKLSPAGRRLWSRTTLGLGGLAAEANGVVLRPGGGVYVVGRTQAAATGWDAMLVRYGSSGSATFLRDWRSPGDEDLMDVAVTANGTLAAVGSSTVGGNAQTFQLTYRSDGTAGSSVGGGAFTDAFVAVAVDSYGGYYAVGYRGTAADRAQWDIWRLASVNGNAGWHSQLYGASGIDLPGPAFLLGAYGDAVAVHETTVYVVGAYATGGPSGVDQQIAVFMY